MFEETGPMVITCMARLSWKRFFCSNHRFSLGVAQALPGQSALEFTCSRLSFDFGVGARNRTLSWKVYLFGAVGQAGIQNRSAPGRQLVGAVWLPRNWYGYVAGRWLFVAVGVTDVGWNCFANTEKSMKDLIEKSQHMWLGDDAYFVLSIKQKHQWICPQNWFHTQE